MGFIQHATALLIFYMNGLLTVLSCVNESSRNATLGEDIVLNPNYTDCETCSVEWTFSLNSTNRRISSYIKAKESTSEAIFGVFKRSVIIQKNGLYLRLPSVQFNDTGKYTRTLIALNGMETCVSILLNVHGEPKKINQSNAEVHSSRTITYLSVSIIGAILGVIIILALITWIVRKAAGTASSSGNRSSQSIQTMTDPIYGNWKNRRGV
ncbi:uncharacterized protein si:ch211-213a13.1 [Heptranchias perlo]|uniref:uncharacterized protein si:ch211-213a13.1 n=1 Tax=Heptranchias perlo TaxID=212740 RepID=UPI00355ACCA0